MQSHELIALLPFLSPEAVARAAPPRPEELTADGPRTFLLRGEELHALKARIASGGDPLLSDGVAKLRDMADALLVGALPNVTQKKSVPEGLTPNDYYSQAIYFWPNPDTPDHLPYIRKDGEVNPEAMDVTRFDAKRLERFVNALFVLSLAYYFTDEEVYGRRAASMLRAWFVTPKTRQTPHFKFAQSIPGVTQGRSEGVIEARRYLYVLDAEALLDRCETWTVKDRTALRDWFAEFEAWLRESEAGKEAAQRPNNIGLWTDVQLAIYALFLGEKRRAQQIVRASVERRLAQMVAPDGSQPLEMKRAQPYDYAAFNLIAMMGLARAGEAAGFDAWWTETADGRSFARALDWLTKVAHEQRDARIPIQIELEETRAALEASGRAIRLARERAEQAEAFSESLTARNRAVAELLEHAVRREEALTDSRRALQSSFEENERALVAQREEIAALQATLAQVRADSERTAEAMTQLEAARLKLVEDHARTQAALSSSIGDHAAAAAALAEAQEQARRLGRALEEANLEVERQAAQAHISETALQERLHEVEAQLADVRQKAAAAATEAARVGAALEAKAEALARRDADLAEATAERDSERAAAAAREAEAKARLDQLAAEYEAARRDATLRREEAARLLAEAQATADARAAETAETVAGLHAQLDAAQAASDELRHDLAEAQARAAALESERAAATASLQSDLAAAQDRVARSEAQLAQVGAAAGAREADLLALLDALKAELAMAQQDALSRAAAAAGEVARLQADIERTAREATARDVAQTEEIAGLRAALAAAQVELERRVEARVQSLVARAERAQQRTRRLLGAAKAARKAAADSAVNAEASMARAVAANEARRAAEEEVMRFAAELQESIARSSEAEHVVAHLRVEVSEMRASEMRQAEAAARQINEERSKALSESRKRAQQEQSFAKERARRDRELEVLRERLEKASRALSAVHTSTSWRVTEPMRALTRFVRREDRPAVGHGDLSSSLYIEAPTPPRKNGGPSDAGLEVKSDAPAAKPNGAHHGPNGAVPHAPAEPTLAPAPSAPMECLPDYIRALEGSVDALERSALRHRSNPARDLMARIATGGALGYDALRETLDAPGGLTQRLREVGVAQLNARALYSLARIVGNQVFTERDEHHSVAIYDAFIDLFNRNKLRQIDHILYVDLLTRAGRKAEAKAALDKSRLAEKDPTEYACLLANIVHPGADASAAAASEWLAAINSMLTPHGLDPVTLTDAKGPLITRLHCAAAPLGGDLPLISVLMTTFNPDDTLDMAIQSVLTQTWRNVELIIIDDCSTDEIFAKVKAYEGQDHRVKVLRATQNQGTYAAKNRGLEIARGKYVTCHDSDDWSHPRKLEIQALQLEQKPSQMANLTSWLRATPAMEMQRFSATGKMLYPNTSSLMFRREPVLTQCGYYDNVRTGADSEFYRRIELVFGQDVPVRGDPTLSFGQVRAGALTHTSLGNGWESPDRKSYRSSWRYWHERKRASGVRERIDQTQAERRFHAPGAILPDLKRETDRTFDVIVATDYRLAGGNTTAALEEIKANARAGLRTGICQIDSFRRTVIAKDMLDHRILDVLRDGLAEQVHLEERAQCRLLLVRYPAALQFVTGLRSGIRAEQVRIVANQTPAEADGSDRRYDPAVVSENAAALFGRTPIWTPIGPFAREALTDLVPRGQLSPLDWRDVADIDDLIVERAAFVADRPVIGRASRDDPSKWPEDADMLRAIYPTDGSVHVHVFGGLSAARGVLGDDVGAWTDAPEKSSREFLRSVDYFVYFHHTQRVETHSPYVMEALASGCVVILPWHFEPMFQEGALYCDAGEVQARVWSIYRDRKRHFEQARRGQRFAQEHFGYVGHAKRVREIIGAG